MTVENQADVDGILCAGRVVARVRDAMLKAVEPGMTTLELDTMGAELLANYGARSAPRGMYDFPGTTCISINEEAAHGIPGERKIMPGDIVNVDVSAELNGYFADTGGTIVVPPATELKSRLCQVTQLALKQALSVTKAGARINKVGSVVSKVANQYGFEVIRNLGGHGIGRSLHEAPEGILSFCDSRDKRRFKLGQVVAIEPFLSTRSTVVSEGSDGWTLLGHPDNLSAQFEHTVIITRGKPIIATLSAMTGKNH